MKFYFHELAAKEFDRAVQYYEECSRGLGEDFSKEIYATISRIVEFPEAWTPLSKNSRRCLVNRFPYGVIYQIERGFIRIIAISDLRRRPNHWQDRE